MMPIHLRINPRWEDLVSGESWNPRTCAISAYIKRAYPQFTHPSVTDKFIQISDPEERVRYRWATPLPVISWLKTFDKGQNPGCLDFYLRRDEAIKSPIPERDSLTRQRARDYNQDRKARLADETVAERRDRLKRNEARTKRARRGRV